mgnify:CR=1 FL=1
MHYFGGNYELVPTAIGSQGTGASGATLPRERHQRAEIYPEVAIEVAHLLQCAMDEDRLGMAVSAQFGDHALRLAQRIGAHDDAPIGRGVERGQ